MLSYFCQDVPHTPFPFLIIVQANGPWKGPKTRESSFWDVETK